MQEGKPATQAISGTVQIRLRRAVGHRNPNFSFLPFSDTSVAQIPVCKLFDPLDVIFLEETHLFVDFTRSDSVLQQLGNSSDTKVH